MGDCAFVPDIRNPGKSHPPTAQHAIREGKVVAQNIAATLLGRRLKAIFVQNHRAAGLDRSPDGRGADSWFQFLGLLRLVDVADGLPQQVARLGQEGSCGV